MLDLGHVVEHILGLPDLISFSANDVSVVGVSRCELAHGTLLGEYLLALILKMMTGNLLKTIANWVVLTPTIGSDRVQVQK